MTFVVKALLLLTTTALGAVVSTCNNPSITAAITTAQSTCLVAKLAYLRPGDSLSGEGSQQFCASECIGAVAKVVRAWASCGDETSPDRRLHERLLREQYECYPPHSVCADTLAQYKFWTKSAQGVACGQNISRARAIAASDPAQAQNIHASLCTGSCTTTIEGFFAQFQAQGCSGWAIVPELKAQQSVRCAKVDTQYCAPIYYASRYMVAGALDATKTVAAREAILATLCTPCFYEVQKHRLQSFAPLQKFDREPEVCLRDTDKFCLPEFEATMATLAGQSTLLNANNKQLCRPLLKRCANIVWAARAAQWITADADAANYGSFLRYACLHRADGTMCATVMDGVASGNYRVSEPGRTCLASSVTGQCRNPGQCQNWSPTTSVCPFGCAQAVDADIKSFGCCFKSTKTLYREVLKSPSTTDLLFARTEFLANECCAFAQSGCAQLIYDQCELLNKRVGNGDIPLVATVAIPHTWIVANSDSYNTAFQADLEAALGVPPGSVAVSTVVALTTSTSRITFIVGAQAASDTDQITNLYELLLSSNGLLLPASSAAFDNRLS